MCEIGRKTPYACYLNPRVVKFQLPICVSLWKWQEIAEKVKFSFSCFLDYYLLSIVFHVILCPAKDILPIRNLSIMNLDSNWEYDMGLFISLVWFASEVTRFLLFKGAEKTTLTKQKYI